VFGLFMAIVRRAEFSAVTMTSITSGKRSDKGFLGLDSNID